MNKEQTIEDRIAEETALIKKIEAGPWPKEKNTEWYIMGQELEDAYWRRRNLRAQL